MEERKDYNSIPITAVEWLIEQIDDQDNGDIPMWIYDYCEKAKQMEKEQIMDAFLNGKVNHSKLWSEEYYNQTYQPKSEVK
jgi:hypothetical protein